jgi:hypothetical protein
MTCKTKPTVAQRKARATRRAAWATFGLGATASLGANLYASNHTAVGLTVGVWPAVAFLLTVWLYEHAPRNWYIRVALLVPLTVAAWTSYWHIVEVATAAGEGPVTAHLLPLTVDCMMAVASAVVNRKAAPSRPVRRRPAAKPKLINLNDRKKSA